MPTLINKQKPSSTSAATTAFCAHKLVGPDGFLWIDGNGKVTAGNGTLDDPKPNAFSLVEIEDCPGATDTCKTACYVHGLKKHAPETHALYQHNSKEIRRILRQPHAGWAQLVGYWIADNCQGGFRWHVSGDIFSLEYAAWIAEVIRVSPNVRHWIYTRSFDLIGPLLPHSTNNGGNLAINLSCDKDNYVEATFVTLQHNLRLCYLTDDGCVPKTLVDGDVIFPDYSLRGGTEKGQQWFASLTPAQKSYTCPVDFHGKAENRRCGPCDRCMK